ncbi:MAG: hypothetical protein Q8M11_19230 [Sulfuritalea sp.]|nr:hypothetical protein [Sulfuritalea sp.]MDP1983342.1 hypothetical protein [Sulfuritalea sp.]
MTIWKDSKIATLYYSNETASERHPCVVKIDDTTILVEYEDEGSVQYRGRNNGDGHFELQTPDLRGTATLHMCQDGTTLEGSWIEDGTRGMWRIDLE